MGDSFSVEVLIGFHVFIIAMLALDLGVFNKHAHHVSVREAAIWSVIWVLLAGCFGGVLYNIWPDREVAHDKTMEFFTAYVMEKSMSLDNLFVFTVIFGFFAIPDKLKHKVLFWGILGAFFFRGTLITAGAVALHYLHWLTYPLALFLAFGAYKLWTAGDADPVDPSHNRLVQWAKRHFRVHDAYDTDNFFVRKAVVIPNLSASPNTVHLRYITPLFLVLLCIESTDILFATDSIPAILGVTQDWVIVYTSNIFAILGLRSLFFIINDMLDFRFLNSGMGCIMAWVAFKMFVQEWLPIPTVLSTIVIFSLLGLAITASLIWPAQIDVPLERTR